MILSTAGPPYYMMPPTPCSWMADERICTAAIWQWDHKAGLGVVEVSQIHVVGCRGGGGALVREGNQLPHSPALPEMAFTVLYFHHTPFKLQRKGQSSGFF